MKTNVNIYHYYGEIKSLQEKYPHNSVLEDVDVVEIIRELVGSYEVMTRRSTDESTMMVLYVLPIGQTFRQR